MARALPTPRDASLPDAAPRRPSPALARLWAGWRDLARHIGDFQARWLLTLFYLTVALPFALVARALDPLRAGRRAGGWRPRPAPAREATLAAARRQF